MKSTVQLTRLLASRRQHGLLVASSFRTNQQHACFSTLNNMNNFSLSKKREQQEEDDKRHHRLPDVRQYHSATPVLYRVTDPVERAPVTIAVGLGAVSAAAFAGAEAVRAFQAWKASQPEVPPEEEEAANTAKSEDQTTSKKGEEKKKDGPRENIFAKWFGSGGKYYEGGFDDEMTRREAALILGVRESSNVQRIKEAHRNLLILNHPDTGGSTYVSGKINEAKELLLKGKAK